jgi:hypothetical protein
MATSSNRKERLAGADRARRKAAIFEALVEVCSSLARLPEAKPDRSLYREVATFLDDERRRLMRVGRGDR